MNKNFLGKVEQMQAERNIVLTGLGRSGTTLTCHLLNKLPDTVALAEPIAPGKFEDLMPDIEAVCDDRKKKRCRSVISGTTTWRSPRSACGEIVWDWNNYFLHSRRTEYSVALPCLF